MTVLYSLVRAYDRLPDAPPVGYSSEKISFVISLKPDGSVAAIHDWREHTGKKAVPKTEFVPQPVKRTAGIAPNFLWDKTSYVLGVTAGEGKRTAEEHKAFVDRHLEAIGESDDEGLRALLAFLTHWKPEAFQPPLWPEEMRDQNVIFELESEHRLRFLHMRPAARALWARVSGEGDARLVTCLLTGEQGPVARLHPSIKGVLGAQSSGAALVSYNLDAFTSYGHEQGENAQISEASAFAYTTVLNRFLERDSGHRIQIGNASTAFWADAEAMAATHVSPADLENAEDYARLIFETEAAKIKREDFETKKIKARLDWIVKGKPLADVEPTLAKGVTFHVLGLSPNAARISVRYYWQGSFGDLTDNYRAYMRDLEFHPWPEERPRPGFRQCVARLGIARIDRNNKVSFDQDQIPDQFAGEFMRAAISGGRFPSGLLGHLLMRIRSDHLLDAVRIAMIKAVLVRDLRLQGKLPTKPDGNPDEDYLMHPDADDPNPARQLGRLFAIMERVQSASLGEEVNATIKDKYLSAAAATPQQVFNGLMLLTEKHLSRLRRGHSDAEWVANAAKKAGIGTGDMARRIGSGLGNQMGKLAADLPGFPAQHDRDEQGHFMIGYYQERFGRKGDANGPETDSDTDALADTEKD